MCVEATHEQVLASLQNIFVVQVPGSAQSAQTPPPRTEMEPPSLDPANRNLLKTETTARLISAKNPRAASDTDFFVELTSDILMEVLSGMAQSDVFPPGVSRKNLVGMDACLLDYLFQCWSRVQEEEKTNKKVRRRRNASIIFFV